MYISHIIGNRTNLLSAVQAYVAVIIIAVVIIGPIVGVWYLSLEKTR
jgi:hypothetical protein